MAMHMWLKLYNIYLFVDKGYLTDHMILETCHILPSNGWHSLSFCAA